MEPLVLGIETSCDETGIGIVRGTRLFANVISSSMEEHARYGGVVPEVAARAHLEALTPALRAALAEADVSLADLDAIAVTSGPGLSGALMVGVGAAFDFHSGRVKQAPRWMQRSGLEWFYRLCSEPRRLAWRYLRNNPLFVFKFLMQMLGIRRYPTP